MKRTVKAWMKRLDMIDKRRRGLVDQVFWSRADGERFTADKREIVAVTITYNDGKPPKRKRGVRT